MNQKELTTKFNYGIYVYETDKWIVDIAEKINNKIDEFFHKHLYSKVCFDITDIDDKEAHCIIEFNRYTGEDEEDAIKTAKEILNKENVSYTFDEYPDVDDNGSSYSYSFKISRK